MGLNEPEFETFLKNAKMEHKKADWDDVTNTLVMAAISAALAFWAYQSLAHTVLFGFLTFSISAVGNRVTGEMRRQRTRAEAERFIDQV